MTSVQDPAAPPSGRARLQGSRAGRMADPAFRAAATASGVLVLAILAWMIASTSLDAWPIFAREGVAFFTGTTWQPGNGRGGVIEGTYQAGALLFGTLVTALLALVVAVPLAIGIALYLTQLAPPAIRAPLTATVDLLAAVPSIIYGLWGSLVLVPLMTPVMQLVANTLGSFLPFLAGPVLVRNLFMASLVLAIMILPIVSAITREVFSAVPRDERDAAYGLGATRWEVMRHVILPRSRPGIIGGSMLGLGRALGETIAVLLIIGNVQRMDFALFQPNQTIAAQIAASFREAAPEHIRALVALGVALFILTIVVNVLARLIVSRIGRVTGDAAL